MTRDSWSRPSESVPSRWSIEKPRRGLATPVCFGSGRWSQLAKMAENRTSAIQPTLIQNTGPKRFSGSIPLSASCRLSMAAMPPWSVTSASAWDSISASAKTPLVWTEDSESVGPPSISSMYGRFGTVARRLRRPPFTAPRSRHATAHPRIHDGVDDVDDEVHHHVRQGDQHDRGLHDEVIALEDRRDGQVADARQGEDHLHDEGAADQRAGVEPRHRDEREGGRPEGVPEKDPAGRQAFRFGHGDEVLLQRRHQVAAQDPEVHRDQR